MISLAGNFQILEAEVLNNQINLLSSITGIENRGRFEEFGYLFSEDGSEPFYETATIIKIDSLKNDLPVFRHT